MLFKSQTFGVLLLADFLKQPFQGDINGITKAF